MLLLRQWILPLCAGTLAGWLAVRWRPAAETGNERGPVSGALQARGQLEGPAAEARRHKVSVISGAGKAEARADRELGTAEDFLRRVAAAGEAELPALYKEMKMVTYSIALKLMETALWRRWVEINPARGMVWMESFEHDYGGGLFSVWLRQDQAAALAWRAANPDRGGNDGWKSFAASASLEEMRRLTEALMADPKALQGFSLQETLTTLAQTDPAEARRLFEGMPADHPERLKMLTYLAEGLPATDPAAAVAWVQGLPLTEGKAEALTTILLRAGMEKPALVRTLAEQCDLPADRMKQVRGSIAAGLAREGPAALQEFLQSLPPGAIASGAPVGVSRMSAGSWNVADMEKLGEEMKRTGLMLHGEVWDWSGRDLVQDLSAVAALPGESWARYFLMSTLTREVMISGAMPPGIEDVQKWPENIRGPVAWQFLGVAARNGDAAAVQKWMPLIPPDQAAPAINMLLGSGDAAELTAARDLLARLPAQPQARAESFQRVGAQWAQTDPAAAAVWAATLPEADQPAAWQGLTDSLALTDDVAASEWVNALPPGPARDGAATALATWLTTADPPAALEWALNIGDGTRRQGSLESLANDWLNSEGPAAVEALRAAPLQEADRALVDKAIEAAQQRWKEAP